MKTKLLVFGALVVSAILVVSCAYSSMVTAPPDYYVQVSMSNTGDQVFSGKIFSNGLLLGGVAPLKVEYNDCGVTGGNKKCPEKVVAKIPGAPVTRLFTNNMNSGTSKLDQSIQFEAQGANGSLNFSVLAVVEGDNAKCYVSKMGGAWVDNPDDKGRIPYLFQARPLVDVLDDFSIRITSDSFNAQVTKISPLKLAYDKFGIFEDIKPKIIKQMFEETCVTILKISVIGGVEWGNQAIQDQINQAVVIQNQLDLVDRQNSLLEKQNTAYASRFADLVTACVKAGSTSPANCALEGMKIGKWDGVSLIPFLPQQPAGENQSALPPAMPAVAPTPVKK